MAPVWLTAKALQLCAAGLGAAVPAAPVQYAVIVRTGATLLRQPATLADAEATVRDLLALGADFEAGPLAINGRDFATFGVSAASVFDACALSHADDRSGPSAGAGSPTVSNVAALLRRVFAARITDTIRPMNAAYGARDSWHKVGQAIDFVPASGVLSISRERIRAVMAANGIRLLELVGPGDPGHSNHWHIAFARPDQMIIDRSRTIEGAEDWIVTAANDNAPTSPAISAVDAPVAPASIPQAGEKAPPQWDVFAAQEWHARHGSGS